MINMGFIVKNIKNDKEVYVTEKKAKKIIGKEILDMIW